MKPPPFPNYPPVPETFGELQEVFGVFTFRDGPGATIVPDRRWVRENIVRSTNIPGVPWRIVCHRKLTVVIVGLFIELKNQQLIRKIRSYDGCYVPRRKMNNPDNSLSVHSWGIALDFNAKTNMPGTPGDISDDLIRLFCRHGFYWGGNFGDPMHFQYVTGY